jgi:hypothetical protein
MEPRLGAAPEDGELNVPAEGWKIVVLIECPCDVMTEW